MIRNFETVKAQLSELANVINSFKSEAVQLCIMELILGAPQATEPSEDIGSPPARSRVPRRRKKTASPEAGQTKGKTKRKAVSGTGAVATLAELAETDFFDEPRTINDIMEHCKVKLARSFKANELSGKLGRMVRNVELDRAKNADHQYEYKKH